MNNDEMVVKTVWKSAHAVRDWPGMVTIRRFSPTPRDLQDWRKALADDREKYVNQPRVKILALIDRIAMLEHKLRGAVLAVDILDYTVTEQEKTARCL